MKKNILFIVFLFFGCNSNFSPNGPYRQQLVVYALLDGSSATQLIRVYGTFSPNDYDPLQPSPNTEVQNASVSVYDGQLIYVFHDTTIIVNNGSTGNRSVHAYVNYSLQPVEKTTYTLTVAAQGFDTSKATITSISLGDILPGNVITLTKPGTETTIPIRIALGAKVRAFLPMIVFEYEVQNDGVLRTREVPREVNLNELGEVTKKVYPKISFRDASSTMVGVYETISFNSDAYIATAKEIKNENAGRTVKFKTVLLTLIQFDNDLYTYYSVANNFAGSATLRLDEPDYTNIGNGFGVFGMQTKQVKTYGLPPDF
jgi:hypothetical protein